MELRKYISTQERTTLIILVMKTAAATRRAKKKASELFFFLPNYKNGATSNGAVKYKLPPTLN